MISEELRETILDYLGHTSAFVKQAQALIRKEAGETPPPRPGIAFPGPYAAHYAMRALQEFLLKEGYDPGPADGVWGPRVAAALRAYLEQLGFIQ
jgi:peptidoglycan hydrolase-like protein with peptidoglycan-binding domain